jgi:hypothetical protein
MSDALLKLNDKIREQRQMLREAARLAGAADPSARGNRHRELMAARSRAHSLAVADIGEIPPVANPERRERCRLDLMSFLQTYFPASTGLRPFSEDHKRAIGRIQRCILTGGLFVNAFPRGFAKTTISENATIWAAVYGHRRFVPIFGAEANAAAGNIDSIKLELSENELLAEDFPEVCFAIQALEGKPQRCASQTHKGVLTHIEWRADTIVFPTIPGSVASGCIITARGITAASRGMKHKRPDGKQQRPDFVLIDDPQTDESAGTDLQVTKRLGTIQRSILKLGGHDRRIACVVNATVIARGDIVEQLLNPKKFPAWQGERIKMVRAWSTAHDTLWLGDYARLRNTYDAGTLGDQQRAHREATAFYKRNRAAMDAGCLVAWEHCYDRDVEISAIQHAYNLLIDDGPEVFASECQNEPLEPARGDAADRSVARCRLHRPEKGHAALVGPRDSPTASAARSSITAPFPTSDAATSPRGQAVTIRWAIVVNGDSWEAVLYGGLDALVNLTRRPRVGPQRRGEVQDRADPDRPRLGRCGRHDRPVLPAERRRLRSCCRPRAFTAVPRRSRRIQRPESSEAWRAPRARAGEFRSRRQRAPARQVAFRFELVEDVHRRTASKRQWAVAAACRIFGDKPEPHQPFRGSHRARRCPSAVEAKGRRVIEWGQSVEPRQRLCSTASSAVTSRPAVQGVSLARAAETGVSRRRRWRDLKKHAQRLGRKTESIG